MPPMSSVHTGGAAHLAVHAGRGGQAPPRRGAAGDSSPGRLLVTGQLAGGGGDVAGVEAGPGEEFLTGSGAGHLPNGEVRDGQVLLPRGEQGVSDSGAEPAFGVV